MTLTRIENTFDIYEKRKNTDSIKFDFNSKMGKPEGLIPLWVADMDFMSPIEVRQALQERIEHGIFGYSDTNDTYLDLVKQWFYDAFNYKVEREWIVETPGIVFALSTAIKAFTENGDAILIQPPVYPPFSECISKNERRIVVNPLKYDNGKYTIDYTDFEHKIINESVKMFILCSPHNPVGRVWTIEELNKMADICAKHHVLILSDEIHADFVYPPLKHHMLASVAPQMQEHIITCTSPSKTFNLAGLQISNVFISNPKLKARFEAELEKTGFHTVGIMGIIACKAAYSHGRPWLNDLLIVIKENIDYVRTELAVKCPKIIITDIEGTYLLWLDFNAYNLPPSELERIIQQDAKLWLNSGTTFGFGGEGFQRLNVATQRYVLEQAVAQLVEAFKDL